jgi:hypothetical protein
MYPRGISSDATTHLAKSCRVEGLWFGKDTDGAWSIALTPQSRD